MFDGKKSHEGKEIEKQIKKGMSGLRNSNSNHRLDVQPREALEDHWAKAEKAKQLKL